MGTRPESRKPEPGGTYNLKDDLILLDYAPDYHNYVSDITRMWPVHDDVRLKLKHHVVHLCDSHWHRPAYASWGSSSKVKHWKSPGKGNRNGLSGDFFPPEQEICAAVKGRA